MPGKENYLLNLIIEIREAYCLGFKSIHKTSFHKQQYIDTVDSRFNKQSGPKKQRSLNRILHGKRL